MKVQKKRYCLSHECTVRDPINGDPWNCSVAEWEPPEEGEEWVDCQIVDAWIVASTKVEIPSWRLQGPLTLEEQERGAL